MEDKSILRLSMDGKARVNIGLFDRGGKSRAPKKTHDHDYDSKTTVTPYLEFRLKTCDHHVYVRI